MHIFKTNVNLQLIYLFRMTTDPEITEYLNAYEPPGGGPWRRCVDHFKKLVRRFRGVTRDRYNRKCFF